MQDITMESTPIGSELANRLYPCIIFNLLKMKKLQKFSFNNVRILSSEEMGKLTGSEYLYTICNKDNVGKSCLYTSGENNYTGVCSVEYTFSSGTGTSFSVNFYCHKS